MEFDDKIINLTELLELLKNNVGEHTVETDLLKHFFPKEYEKVMFNGISLDMFKMHFVLYHYLHKLSRTLIEQESEYIIYIKYIYIFLIKKPHNECCQYFNDEFGSFCAKKLTDKEKRINPKYCEFHLKREKEKLNYLTYRDISHYYLDFSNYYKMDEDGLEKTISKVLNYINCQSSVEESLKILELDINNSFEDIRKKYKSFSKKYHPDINKNKDAEEKYKQINNAYQILKNYHS